MLGRVGGAALAASLFLSLAMPTSAAAGPGGGALPFPVRLASTSVPAPWFTSGVVAGRFGGVPVIGSFRGTTAVGLITLTVHRVTFAYGSYVCFRKSCTFAGLLAGVRVKGIALPINLRGASRTAVGTFPNRGAWVATVTDWARRHLSPDLQRAIVAAAAEIPS